MPTIIDSLVVTLGLDPANYDKGAREKQNADKKIRDSNAGLTRDMEISNKRAGESFGKLKNEAVGLFLTFAGASSVTSFISNLLTGDAATGRFAKNLGLSTKEVSTWELAVKSAGGTAEDANSAIGKFSSLYQDALSGRLDPGSGTALRMLGLNSVEDLKDPAQGLMKLAEAADRFKAQGQSARFAYFAQSLGITPGMISLLQKGSVEVKRITDEKRKLAADDKAAENAQKFEQALGELADTIKNEVRPLISDMVKWFTDLDDKFGLIQGSAPLIIPIFAAIGVAATAALGPVGLLAAALGGLYLQLKNFDLSNGWGQLWDLIKKGDSKGASDHLRGGLRAWGAQLLTDPLGAFGWGGGGGTPAAGGGGQAAGSGNAGGGGSNAAWFRSKGFSDAQARGIAAGIHAESKGDPNARNPTSGAFGIGQWLGPRKKTLFARYGYALDGSKGVPTLAQQREFMLWELNGGDRGGSAVKGATTDVGALDAYIDKFMRPAQGYETNRDKVAGRQFLGLRSAAAAPARAPSMLAKGQGGDSHTTIGTIVVHTAATDAKGIAKDLRGAINRRTTVSQANRGLE